MPPVPRLGNGYRSYSARHLAALHTIRALRAAGYTRDEMTTIMSAIHAGSIQCALAIIDRHHAAIDERRRWMLALNPEVLDMVNADQQSAAVIGSQRIPIGRAAALVGVRPSTLRFWESLGLLEIERDKSNGYREFGEIDLLRIDIIKRMRSMNCSWEMIRGTFQELEDASQSNTQRVVTRQFNELDYASCMNTRATALVWSYTNVTDDTDLRSVDAFFRVMLTNEA